MSDTTNEIKLQVEAQLKAALGGLKDATSFSDIHEALVAVLRMCRCLDGMYRNNSMEIVTGAASGAWAEAIDMLPDDDC